MCVESTLELGGKRPGLLRLACDGWVGMVGGVSPVSGLVTRIHLPFITLAKSRCCSDPLTFKSLSLANGATVAGVCSCFYARNNKEIDVLSSRGQLCQQRVSGSGIHAFVRRDLAQ